MLDDEVASGLSIVLPEDYRVYRDQGGGNLPPWAFLEPKEATRMRSIIGARYPRHADCLPFAENLATDDLAVFTPQGKVRPIHMFAEEGWESVEEYDSFG